MKKMLFLAAMLLGAWTGVQAQGQMFVNSETIFKSQADYNSALAELEQLTQQTQQTIDEGNERLQTLYDNYQSQRSFLSDANRTAREEEIINLERGINAFQEESMGPDGTLMKRRVELIKPIQDRVFGSITQYAEANRFTMVVDIVNNQSLLYYSPSLDKTNDIINLLNK